MCWCRQTGSGLEFWMSKTIHSFSRATLKRTRFMTQPFITLRTRTGWLVFASIKDRIFWSITLISNTPGTFLKRCRQWLVNLFSLLSTSLSRWKIKRSELWPFRAFRKTLTPSTTWTSFATWPFISPLPLKTQSYTSIWKSRWRQGRWSLNAITKTLNYSIK